MAEKAEIAISGKDQTAAAFLKAKQGLKDLQSAAVSAGATVNRALGAIGLATVSAGAAVAVLNPKPIIDQADALNKLSQRTGIAVETLSGYQSAAKLADVSVEELSGNLKKLNLNNQRLMIISKPLYYSKSNIALVKVTFYRNIEHNNGSILLLEKTNGNWVITAYLNSWST